MTYNSDTDPSAIFRTFRKHETFCTAPSTSAAGRSRREGAAEEDGPQQAGLARPADVTGQATLRQLVNRRQDGVGGARVQARHGDAVDDVQHCD